MEREIAQWVHPMKDRSDDSSHHERTLLPRSYISLPVRDRSDDSSHHERTLLPRSYISPRSVIAWSRYFRLTCVCRSKMSLLAKQFAMSRLRTLELIASSLSLTRNSNVTQGFWTVKKRRKKKKKKKKKKKRRKKKEEENVIASLSLSLSLSETVLHVVTQLPGCFQPR